MTVRIELGESSYDVVLEPGCLSHAGELLDLDRKGMVLNAYRVRHLQTTPLLVVISQPMR